MWFNIWSGLIIPAVFGLRLFKSNKKLVLKIFAFVWVLSTLVNLWGNYNKFWMVKPKLKRRQFLTKIPFILGLYPTLSALMVYFIKKTQGKNNLWVVTFSLFTTFTEFCMLVFGWVKYRNGWNITKTFFSYLIPYYLVYRFYLWTESND